MTEATDDRLRLLIERVERINEELKGVQEPLANLLEAGK